MDKALEMGKSSATGSFHLMIGVAGSTVIMSIGTLILAALLDKNQLGLYGTALIPSSMINFFRDWGVNSAMIQQIASLRDAGRDSEIHDVIHAGILFEVITGIALSLICFAVAWPLALILSPENASELSLYIAIMSLSIFAGAILSAASSIFVGYEKMKLNSFTQIFQAVVKTALGPLLIVLGFGVFGAVYAAAGSFIAGGVAGILIAYFGFYLPLHRVKVGKCNLMKTLKPMLKYGIPLTVSGIVIGVLPQVFAFMMVIYAGISMMSNYFVAVYFSVLLTFISFPVATALFPVFSKMNPEKEPELVKTVYASSVKYTAVLLVPATMALITLATPIVHTLFREPTGLPKYPFAPLFLALSSIINLYILIGNISLGTFQTGIGKTGQVMKQSLLSLAVGLPLAYLMVAYFYSLGGANAELSASLAVIGGIFGNLIASTPGMVWGLYWSWKNYRVKADFHVSAKIFAASLIASVTSYFSISLLNLPYWMLLAIGFVVFLVVYLASAPIIGAVNQTDLDNLKAMFSGLGIVSKLLDVPLLFMKKCCRANNAKKVLHSNP